MQPSPTRDPIALRVVQPIVDRTGIDPASGSKRAAEVMVLAVVTSVALNLGTLDATILPGLYLAETMHLAFGVGIAMILIRVAPMGPSVLLHPSGWLHPFARIMAWAKTAWYAWIVSLYFASGLARHVPISVFRELVQTSEATALLVALYLGICRRPPPRGRDAHIPGKISVDPV